MRVIAGTARRLQLKTLDGMDTRPTTDRIKETLFNMISAELYDSNFLDLFSGSGGIIIVEASKETDLSYAEELGYSIIKEKMYKTNKHIFLEKE